MDLLPRLGSFLTSSQLLAELNFWPEFVVVYGWVRMVGIVVDLLLCVGFLYALFNSWRLRPDLEFGKGGGGKGSEALRTLRASVNLERWKGIVRKTESGSTDSLRIAVIEIDALVDDVLKQAGFEGDSMADRLQEINPDEILSLNRVWRAHRIRNDLVHTPGFFLSNETAQTALQDFEAFLKEIKAFD